MGHKPRPLNRSVRDGQRKSCPRCSVLKGRLVFHPLEKFGYRDDGGVERIQSWCEDCRNEGKKDRAEEERCSHSL